MKSVLNNEHTITIKNSKFICFLYHIDTEEDIAKNLKKIKSQYPDATHHCYAYILDTRKKSSDDGEPNGTAGIPILQVLEKNNLNHVLCIVVRYFGKIKLGAGGLVRAYTKSVTDTLKNHITILEKGASITITFSYDKLKIIDHLLKDKKIIKKDFKTKITYQAHISLTTIETLKTIQDITIKIDHYLFL